MKSMQTCWLIYDDTEDGYFPFASKQHALAFMLINGPRPMVRLNFKQYYLILTKVRRVNKTKHKKHPFYSYGNATSP